MLVVVITGPPGAGKSTAATAVHDLLGAEGVANALIEVDELERAYPPLGDRVFAHLGALATSYRAAGYGVLFVTATLEDADYATRMRDAIAADERLVVLLLAEPQTCEQRVREREPPGWAGLEPLAASARALATTMVATVAADLTLETGARGVAEVRDAIAAEVRRRLALAR